MINALKNLLPRRTAAATAPVCLWTGDHSPGETALLEITRDCGHGERNVAACPAHVRLLLGTGGLAERPAPCAEVDCGVVSRARIRRAAGVS